MAQKRLRRPIRNHHPPAHHLAVINQPKLQATVEVKKQQPLKPILHPTRNNTEISYKNPAPVGFFVLWSCTPGRITRDHQGFLLLILPLHQIQIEWQLHQNLSILAIFGYAPHMLNRGNLLLPTLRLTTTVRDPPSPPPICLPHLSGYA